jgi:predicted PurR-regulated permease PerM
MAEITPPPVRELITGRWVIALALLVVAVFFFYLLTHILFPFVLGALVAYLGDPLVDFMERYRINRTLGVVVVFLFMFSILLVGLLFLVPMLVEQLDALVRKIPLFYQWATQVVLPWMQEKLGLSSASLPELDWAGQLAGNWQSLGKIVAEAGKQVTGSGASILMGVANLILVPVVAFYLMRDWDVIMGRIQRILPLRWQKRVSSIVGEADEVVGAFLRGQFIVMCALGLIYGTGLWLLGLQLALLLGFVAGIASLVPYLGFVVGIVSSLIAAYSQFSEWTMMLWVVLVFCVGQVIESMLLTPVLVGDRIGLHPVAVIFALLAGGQLAGFVGVVVALPVAAVITIFARHGVDHYRASDIYGRDDT